MMPHSQIIQELEGGARRLRPRLNLWTGMARLLPESALVRVRCAFYKLAGCRIGRGVILSGTIRMLGDGDVASRLTIEDGAFVGVGVTLGLDGCITLGKNAALGPDVILHTATHQMGASSRRMELGIVTKPIVVEEGAWIAMRAVILPGVTIGRGAVVAAGAVVTKDVSPNTLVGGSPAQIIKHLATANH